MIELNKIYNCDCLEGMRRMEDNSVDLTVTSCPYDNLRTYTDKNSGECEWNFEIFKPIAQELYRVTKKGGIVVWVVGDATINGEETGSSFRQALYFQELGFKLHDTMIYEKNSSSFPAKLTSKRYTQIFEYMFIFCKGKIRDDIKLIADKKNKWAGWTNWGNHSQYDKEGNLVQTGNIKPIAEFSLRNNIWRYPVSFNDKTNHPAVFPEKLAEDHILSWSCEGDTVLDPFMGSGTTAKMAKLNHRNYIGFERNTEYYEESLKRVGKYDGVENTLTYSISAPDIKDYEKMTTADEQWETLQVNPTVDKDDDKKRELWEEKTTELQEYFNTQSYGILKNLKVTLTFASKSNDERVNKVLEERGETPISIPTVTIPQEEMKKFVIKDNFAEEDCLFTEESFEESSFPECEQLTPEKFDKALEEVNSKYSSNEAEFHDARIENYINKVVLELLDKELPKRLIKTEYVSSPCFVEDKPNYSNECTDTFCSSIVLTEKKHRGRPKGSKNKPKENKIDNE